MRGLGVHAALLALGWGTLFLYAIHGALPFNPVRLPFEEVLMVPRFLPQGWAFFSRSPRDERLTSHRLRADGRLEPLGRSPHSRWSNGLGLDRRSRAEGVELALLVAAAREQDADPWTPCEGSPDACARALERTGRAFAIAPAGPKPLLCGDVVLKLEAPTPWAWSKSPPSARSRLLALRIRC